jgi:hypothetical protein
MKKITIAVIDIVDKRRKTQVFSRLVQANTASIRWSRSRHRWTSFSRKR